jgi:hypothetical protein
MTIVDSPACRTEILHDTSRAAVAADELHLAEAVRSVVWQRRGFLQMLTRVRRRDGSERD